MLGHSTLDLSAAVGRFAVTYVRSVCAQSHVGFVETSSGEDVLAIDGLIQYREGDLRVQIKGTTQKSLTPQTGTIDFAIDEKWRDKWLRNGKPTYFIYVLMEKHVPAWFDCQPTLTHAGAFALWARIDNLSPAATHVQFDRTQRFTADTVGAWHESVYGEGYGGAT
ncbi:DUF4365 domain-containing protein [Aeromicrobium alkaliterrae]|uniref:DUF4365 domain-containing protein n=1 Tax=Aeromicrobium alkaliterrae TaxID=302168 RepID=A0ABN2JG47_9ACTN